MICILFDNSIGGDTSPGIVVAVVVDDESSQVGSKVSECCGSC